MPPACASQCQHDICLLRQSLPPPSSPLLDPRPNSFHHLIFPSQSLSTDLPSTMKTPPIAARFLGVLPSQSKSCSSLDNVKITFFGYPDNSPPGAGIAWTNCGHSLAGGTGSYDDPITFATAPDGDFKVCDVVYLPYLRKYARYEDDCEQCSKSSLQILYLFPKTKKKKKKPPIRDTPKKSILTHRHHPYSTRLGLHSRIPHRPLDRLHHHQRRRSPDLLRKQSPRRPADHPPRPGIRSPHRHHALLLLKRGL